MQYLFDPFIRVFAFEQDAAKFKISLVPKIPNFRQHLPIALMQEFWRLSDSEHAVPTKIHNYSEVSSILILLTVKKSALNESIISGVLNIVGRPGLTWLHLKYYFKRL